MRWVAFQRAVNIGQRPYPMAQVRAAVEEAGFTEVATHIQTGNIVFTSSRRSASRIAQVLEDAFVADVGFEVPTIVMRVEALPQIVADAETLQQEYGAPARAHYVEIMRTPPVDPTVLESNDRPGQRAVVRGSCLHLLLDLPFHELKPFTATQRRELGVSTNRNLSVVRALAQKWAR